jgi:hypothetical protein
MPSQPCILSHHTEGRRIQIFHHNFYGEGLEIAPGKEYTREATAQPYAGIIWSGAGEINGMQLDTARFLPPP